MVDGKKSVAERIFYASMEIVEAKAKRPALEVFEAALRQLKVGGGCAFICADRWMSNQYGCATNTATALFSL